MDTTFAEAIKTSKTALKQSRDMIKYKGGIATDDKGLVALPEMIRTIPGTGVTTVTDNEIDTVWSIPERSTKYAYLAEFGGMTYSDAEWEGGFSPDGMLYDEAPESFLLGGDVDWDEVPEDEVPPDIVIPPEILALPDYRQGINLQYYNKVDLVEQKYKRCIVTRTFDGSADEVWAIGTVDGTPANYYAIAIGEHGVYAQNVIVCSHYKRASITSSTTNVGITVADRSILGGKCVIALRPDNVAGYTIDTFKQSLANNPITVRIATLVPEVSDLPVYMNPLIYLGVLADVANAYIEGMPNDASGYPAKFIFETIDSQGG